MPLNPILCLDFDGVCHSYTSGWRGVETIPDSPVDGMWDFLERAGRLFEIHIFSARSGQLGGRHAMIEWFTKHCLVDCNSTNTADKFSFSTPYGSCTLHFPLDKPPAFVTIDDRAICFTGQWPELASLINFKPWNKKD